MYKLIENVCGDSFYLKGNKFVAMCIYESQKAVTALTVILCVCFQHICIVSILLLCCHFGWETEMSFLKVCVSILNHNRYWYIDVCRIFKYSIQRSEFDRCANLAQSGGSFSTANGANLTLLVRQLLFFYRQNEDSKRLVSTVTYFDP